MLVHHHHLPCAREWKGIRVFTEIHARGRDAQTRNKAPSPKWIRVNLKGNAADAAIFSIQRDRRKRLRIQRRARRSEPNDFEILSLRFLRVEKPRISNPLLFWIISFSNVYLIISPSRYYACCWKLYRIRLNCRANSFAWPHALFARMNTMMIHGEPTVMLLGFHRGGLYLRRREAHDETKLHFLKTDILSLFPFWNEFLWLFQARVLDHRSD